MNKKLSLLLLFSLTIVGTSFGQGLIGKAFPKMPTQTASNKAIDLPKDTNDKYTLLGLAYSKKSEKELVTWFNPVFQKFISRPKNPGLFSSFAYDVNVYFVPMFTGVNAAATGTAKKKAMKNVDPRLLPHILFYKGSIKPYKDSLNFNKKDIPYFFVVDKAGKIVYSTTGAYTEQKMDDIEEFLDDL